MVNQLDLICLFPSVKAYRKYIENPLMMEAQCAVAETATRGAEPGLAEVKNYFARLENRKTDHNVITVRLAGALSL